MLAWLDFLDPVLRTFYIVLGIGFLIFIHEAGHFLAARWCKVRVEIFSLGFGPALLAWRRGPTEYRVSIIPIGGYVKMAGQEVGEGSGGPDELQSKSVGARFFIYSAGVIMNAVFAFVLFPILFCVGVPFQDPVIGPGGPLPGGPAWQAGLRAGDRIVKVAGHPILEFGEAEFESALGDLEGVKFEIERAGRAMTFMVAPRKNEKIGANLAMLGSPALTEIQPRLEVEEDSAAYAAGLRSGDRLIELDGISIDSERSYARALRPRWPAGPRKVSLLVERRLDAETQRIHAELELTDAPEQRYMIGIEPRSNFLAHVRAVGLLQRSPWREQLLALPENAALVKACGRPIHSSREFRDLLDEPIGAEPGANDGQARVSLRWRASDGSELEPIELVFDARLEAQMRQDLADCFDLRPLGDRADVVPIPGGPAQRAGMRPGDTIVALGEVTDLGLYAGDHDLDIWGAIVALIGEFTKNDEAQRTAGMRIQVRHEDGSLEELRIAPEKQLTLPFGLVRSYSEYIRKESNLLGAIQIGFQRSIDIFRRVYLTMRRMITNQVSAKNMSGIVGISQISYQQTEYGASRFLFFLGLLSINLAFINFLPIPVLDGGHLLFLLIEKVKGSPVNDRVMGYSQMIGLLLVLFLLIFVTFNDIRRLLPG